MHRIDLLRLRALIGEGELGARSLSVRRIVVRHCHRGLCLRLRLSRIVRNQREWEACLRLGRHEQLIVILNGPIGLCVDIGQAQLGQYFVAGLRVHVTVQQWIELATTVQILGRAERREFGLRLDVAQLGAEGLVLEVAQRARIVFHVIQMVQIAIGLRCIANHRAALFIDEFEAAIFVAALGARCGRCLLVSVVIRWDGRSEPRRAGRMLDEFADSLAVPLV